MSEEWTATTVGEIATICFSSVDKHILPGERHIRLCNYMDVYRNRRITSSIDFAPGSATLNELARFQLQKGDVLVTKDSETPDDIGLPAVVTEDLPDTICGYHLAQIRPKKGIDSRFIGYHFLSDVAKRHFLQTATGVTRFGLGIRALNSLPISLPCSDEQTAIARILDAADTAIERTRETVKRVSVLRRALMQELLPPWIGFKRIDREQIPEGVETIEIARDVCTIGNGSTPSTTEGRYWRNGTIPWLPTGKVHDRIITQADQFVTESALRECCINLLPPGTVLVGMIGQGRTRGMSAYLDINACINQNFGAFVPRQKVLGKWLFHYFDFHYSRLREIGGGTNQGALNGFILKRLRLPLPTMDKQKEVSDILDEVERLDRSYRIALQHREQLKKSLMHDLLTGTVRVDPAQFKEAPPL